MLRTVVVSLLFAGALCAADLKTEFTDEIASLEKKYVALAEAIPEGKYSWRPADGVRSVSEVLMHVAGANTMLPGMAGIKAEKPIARDAEKTVTAKADVLAQLRQSFGFVRGTGAIAAEPEKTMKIFGNREVSQRYFLSFLTSHLHEHLGQLIAYARMNGVTPPWSQR